ncbi:MAG: triosephosphate isomerase, partial [Gammaproteobacteria bacterium]|nr:triosephosphate isomerase [Gammaproteobacteria bacterium]
MTKLRPLIAANWKMNGNRDLAEEFSKKFSTQQLNNIDVVLCPPSVYLESLITQVAANQSVIKVGAQNISEQAKGAYTGETSTTMLLELGCEYVIIGHSERRSLFGETPELAATKYLVALQAGLTPILCTGESDEQRQQELTFKVI